MENLENMQKWDKLFSGGKSGFTLISILTLFLMTASMGIISPGIATFAGMYPDQSLTNIIQVATLPTLTGLITNFLIGFIVRGLKYKGTLFLGLALFAITGVAPYFFQNSWDTILIWRAINGLGYGIICPLTTTMAAVYYTGYAKATVLGLGNSFANVGGIIFGLAGGFLAAGFVHDIWWLHLIFVIPIILWLFIKEPKVAKIVKDIKDINVPKKKIHVPLITWIYIILFAVYVLFMFTYQLYMSSILAASGMGGPVETGIASTIWAVAGIIVGFIIDKILKLFKSRVLAIGSLFILTLMLALALTNNLPLVYVTTFIAGTGIAIFSTACFQGMTSTCPEPALPTVMGVQTAVISLVIYACPFFMSFVAGIFGQAENVRFIDLLPEN